MDLSLYFAFAFVLGWAACNRVARFRQVVRPSDSASSSDTKNKLQSTLNAVLDASPFGVIITDESGRCIELNQTLSEQLGLSVSEIKRRGWLAAEGWISAEKLKSAWDEFLNVQQKFSLTLEYQRSLSRRIWLRVQAAIVQSRPGEMRIVVTFEDVTSEIRAKAAEDAGLRTKNEFLANVSHEIRTPMNAIIATADLALQDAIPISCQESFEIIREAGEHLSVLMTDILDFSKLEAGKFQMHETQFSPRELANSAIWMCEARAQQKGVALVSEISDDLPVTVVGDEGRIRQILLNLVGNAIKFTPVAGSVIVRAYMCEETENQFCLEFSVEDTGIGIPESKLEPIFDPFQQGDTSLTKEFGGTGLGLAICRQLARLMQGDIFVSSEVGTGSIFTAQVNVGKPSSEPESTVKTKKAPPVFDAASLNILVVEDNIVNQRVFVRMLRRWGIRHKLASNGLQAVECYRESLEKEPFSMIFMDCQMPKMSGYDATREIRVLSRQGGKRVPIIAMTAFAMEGDKEICLASGMDDYLAKPLKTDEVMAAISRWSRRQRRPTGHLRLLISSEDPPDGLR